MPPHAYLPAVAGCWALFGEVQADEMMRFRYPDAHAIVVDAYMASHPGDGTDRREAQSVVVHLVGLCGLIVRGRGRQKCGRLGPPSTTPSARSFLRHRTDTYRHTKANVFVVVFSHVCVGPHSANESE
jgi:Family of unknown function (DUF5946)